MCNSESAKSLTYYIFYILIFYGGVTLLGFGIAYTIIASNYVEIFDFNYGAFAISTATIVLVGSLLGSQAIFARNKILLYITYGVLLIGTVLTCPIGGVALTEVYDPDFLKNVTSLVEGADLGAIERNFKCCGIEGPTYYNTSSYPDTCCQNGTSPCLEPFEIGCASKYAHYIGNCLKIIGWVAFTLFAVGIVHIGVFSALQVPWKSDEPEPSHKFHDGTSHELKTRRKYERKMRELVKNYLGK